jgi:hypothetical protein
VDGAAVGNGVVASGVGVGVADGVSDASWVGVAVGVVGCSLGVAE